MLDFRTGFLSVIGTGELNENEDHITGKISWERKKVVEVPREAGPQWLATVAVRRTKRIRGFKAGRGGDQERVEDLSKPLLVVAHPCGQLQAISCDVQMGAMDTKLIRMVNQRTGSYCYICTATEEEAHCVEKVKQGFHVMNMEELVTLSQELMTEAGPYINIMTVLSRGHSGFISMMKDFFTMVSMLLMI